MAAKRKREWSRPLATPPDRRPPKPERDSAGRVTTRDAAIALAKMKGPELKAHIGIKVSACEGFEPYNRQRRRWTKGRMRELGLQYGDDLTSSVGARVRAAAWGLAFGEWAAAKAAEHGDAGLAALAMKIIEKGVKLDDSAREQAEVEAKLRRKQNKPHNLGKVLDVEGS